MSQVLTISTIVAAALGFIALERRLPYDGRQRFFRKGFALDLVWYTLAQSYVLGIIISLIVHWLDETTGWSRRGIVSDWPVWGQVLFFLVTHDLYIYIFHRMQHWSPLLWRLHEAHHSPHDVDWLSGSRSHPFEILINQTIEFAPIVLLGAAPEVAAIKGILDALWGMYIHSNIDVRSGRLQWLINGPEMHRWHHARELAVPGKNFATKLAIWDWVFGTAYLPEGAKPRAYGLVDEDDARFPNGTARTAEGGKVLWLSTVSSLITYARQVGYAFRLPQQRLARASDKELPRGVGREI